MRFSGRLGVLDEARVHVGAEGLRRGDLSFRKVFPSENERMSPEKGQFEKGK